MITLRVGDLIILDNKTPMFVTCRFPLKRFECKEGGSNKFWEIFLYEKEFTTRWGAIGSEGQCSTKTWKDHAETLKEHGKIIKEKLAKGYKEIQPGENYSYAFNNPAKPGGELWISSFDLEPFMKRNNAKVQPKK